MAETAMQGKYVGEKKRKRPSSSRPKPAETPFSKPVGKAGSYK